MFQPSFVLAISRTVGSHLFIETWKITIQKAREEDRNKKLVKYRPDKLSKASAALTVLHNASNSAANHNYNPPL